MANDKHNQCKECGCNCRNCGNDHDLHLHVEIENLKQKLVERDSHIATMETNVLNEANKHPNGELVAVQEELFTWQDKYKRLYEAHRRIQRVNQGLEDKLLKLVDSSETDKNTLTKDIATLSHSLAEANYTIKKLTEDNERYKNDVALAIQFLQCKQSNFVSQKLDSLPNEVQAKVSSYVAGKRKPEEKKTPPEVRNIKVPIPTFPPTAMVYSIPKSAEKEEPEPDTPTVDIVSAAIMAKVLQERERERSLIKHCDTCTCSKTLKILHDVSYHSIGTQTGNFKSAVCLRCNNDMEIKSSLQIVKSSETMSKNVPNYTHEYDNYNFQVRSNIVKVEPNNYLKEEDDSTLQLKQENHQTNSKEEKTQIKKLRHHHLCERSQHFHDSAKLRGPRYCSVRLQSGSKNILLDNVHTNIAPVLYTHPSDKKFKLKKIDYNSSRSYSSDDRKSCSESVLNQQRVAEWIRSNQNVVDGSPNSNTIDPVKYAEMENNVKKFLFGESQSEFLKKVAIGKQNYQNLRDYNNCIHGNKTHLNRSHSHTETEI